VSLSFTLYLNISLDGEEPEYTPFFEGGVTHNLSEMARSCGLYEALWKPKDIGAFHAGDLIDPLTKGLDELGANPDIYSEYNPSNGWGDYHMLLSFALKARAACVRYPLALIDVGR